MSDFLAYFFTFPKEKKRKGKVTSNILKNNKKYKIWSSTTFPYDKCFDDRIDHLNFED
jgi:hypothetical protein